MELAELLPIIVYALLIVLLVICIIIGYKVIITMNHIEKIVDDVDNKVKSFDKFFNVLNFTTDKLAVLSDTFISKVSVLMTSLFGKKKRKNKGKEDYDDYEV